MKLNWKQVTTKDVVLAINKYINDNVTAPSSRSTFLVYENRKLPAKHIRGMAYEVSTGYFPSKDEYSGGMETIRFFERLGFEMLYTTKTRPLRKENSNQKLDKNKSSNVRSLELHKKRTPQVFQKEALFKAIVTNFNEEPSKEAMFHWCNKFSNLEPLTKIKGRLENYRGHSFLPKRDDLLKFDYIIESEKIIIEYDEEQHFTFPRAIALENYPSDIKVGFDVNKWIEVSKQLNRHDNQPPFRDEQRAYYDSVRDITASENGYLIIRTKHGDFNWESDDSVQYLKYLIDKAKYYYVRRR